MQLLYSCCSGRPPQPTPPPATATTRFTSTQDASELRKQVAFLRNLELTRPDHRGFLEDVSSIDGCVADEARGDRGGGGSGGDRGGDDEGLQCLIMPPQTAPHQGGERGHEIGVLPLWAWHHQQSPHAPHAHLGPPEHQHNNNNNNNSNSYPNSSLVTSNLIAGRTMRRGGAAPVPSISTKASFTAPMLPMTRPISAAKDTSFQEAIKQRLFLGEGVAAGVAGVTAGVTAGVAGVTAGVAGVTAGVAGVTAGVAGVKQA